MISNERFIRELEEELYSDSGIHDCYARYCRVMTIDDLFTTDSVYIAACHCASGFRDRKDTSAFMDHAWLNSRNLAEKVRSGKFKPTYYRAKRIVERGKPRVIRPPKFECKVVRKVLCDYLLRSFLEPKMISTSYAGIRGRGTDRMFSDVLAALNKSHAGNEIVMCDFKGYFSSIDTELLCRMLLDMGMDSKVVELFHSFDPEGIGLSLGNEVSQVPASWFPSAIDHSLKDRFRFRNVFRFMDDMLIITENRERSESCLQIIFEGAESLHLSLNHDKVRIIPWSSEFIFCKERFLFNRDDTIYYRIRNPRIFSNEMRKIRRFSEKVEAGEMTRREAYLQINAVLRSMEKHPNSWKRTEKIENELKMFEDGPPDGMHFS